MKKTLKWLQDNSLSLAFFGMFAAALVGQSASGLFSYNQQLAAHGRRAVGYGGYLGTGDFLDGIFSNWQAAVLQLGCLILFAEALRQKGASHSRKSKASSGKKDRRGGGDRTKCKSEEREPWIYRNSLGAAFVLLFVLSFVAHWVFGAWAYNETQTWNGAPTVPIATYITTADFWFKSVQTWQAEFFGIGVFLVLSIFLRQEGSAESKPVSSSDQETGETNK